MILGSSGVGAVGLGPACGAALSKDVPITQINIVLAGQSNDSGRGDNNQLYTSVALPAAKLFANDNTLKAIADPVDSAVGQVDAVSADTNPAAAGSIWPIVASRMLDYWQYVGAPIPKLVFIPCSRGGSSITDWLPGANHEDRSTLYGSMVHRAKLAGSGQPGVLTIISRIQGETDAGAGMSEAVYAGHLNTIAEASWTDLRAYTVPHTIPLLRATAYIAGSPLIVAAIKGLWGTGRVKAGADISTVRADKADLLHIASDLRLHLAADRVAMALQAACGKPSGLVPSVNMLANTDDMSAATFSGVTVQANQGVNPLTGLTTMDRLTTATDGAASPKYVRRTASVVSGKTYTISAVVKAGSAQFFQMFGGSAQWGSSWANFDILNGTVTADTIALGHIDNLGGGYYRCAMTLPAIATSASTLLTFSIVGSGTAGRAAAGPDGLTALIGALQCEERMGPGPYVAVA